MYLILEIFFFFFLQPNDRANFFKFKIPLYSMHSLNVIIFEEASPGWFWLRNKKRRKGKEKKEDNMAGYFESYQRIPL